MDITEHGLKAQGQSQLKKHLRRERLTRGDAIKAKCYDCCAGYTDGKRDCLIPDCSLHPYMPFRNKN
jgi:hypothetical protein